MKGVRKIIIFIVAILCCISLVVLATDKEYNYTIEGKNGATDEQVKGVKVKIDKIYKYFDHGNYEPKELKFIVSDYNRLEESENEIVIDFNSISDFELMQMILQHEFSSYLNYGLMYGVMYDIASTYDLEFEEINNYSIEEVEEYWDYMFLSYVNFIPEIASETEIEIAKYVATELVSYIIDEHGSEYVFDLMKESAELVHANKVSEALDEWMEKKNPDFKSSKVVNREIFNQNSKDGTIEYSTENINWILNLNNEDTCSELFPSIHESTQVFYDYMNVFYDEISRLEEVLEFDSNELPVLTAKIYPKVDNAGGKYYKAEQRIEFDFMGAFSHEYIHFIDDSLDKNPIYSAIAEMRAVYYSKDFELQQIMDVEKLKRQKMIIEEYLQAGVILTDPVKKVENYLEREITYKDYYSLFNDLTIHSMLESEIEIPNLFDVSSYGYPGQFWISMMNFLIREYGNEAVDTIMFENKLPNGTKKNIDDVIEEWEVYITNLSEEDYGNYYD